MKNKQRHKLKLMKHLMLLSLFAFATAILQAQGPVQLNLKDALNYALQANQNARKAKLDVENSDYQIDEVRSRALPQVRVLIVYQQSLFNKVHYQYIRA